MNSVETDTVVAANSMKWWITGIAVFLELCTLVFMVHLINRLDGSPWKGGVVIIGILVMCAIFFVAMLVLGCKEEYDVRAKLKAEAEQRRRLDAVGYLDETKP